MNKSRKKKIWIDLENSPHVPFFKPVIEELDSRGYTIILTARDCSQTCGLADLLHLRYIRVGRHYGKNKLMKAAGLVFRVLRFMPIIIREKPILAVSHGSRTQMMVARLLKIPSVSIMDYEHTYTVPFSTPDWMIIPEVVSRDAMKPDNSRILKYPGIKEDIYVPDFQADPSIREALKIDGSRLVITIRPPATDAHYFVQESRELFEATMEYLVPKPGIRVIILPRNEKQKTNIQKQWPRWFEEGKIIMPDQVVDGLNLVWHSDLVISGGGTMNREAAALGVPVYSIFRGKIGAVDRYLAETGRLTLLETPDDVRSKVRLERRVRPAQSRHLDRTALKSVVDNIVAIADGANCDTKQTKTARENRRT